MRAHPKGNWKIADLEAVANSRGMTVRKSGGSHAVFSHPKTELRVAVPARRSIKPIYVRQFIELVNEIQSAP
jgi:predicted RNA binding protein YcfA (HicA-like mRNA interferase family)